MENLNAEQIKGDLECCAYGDCKDCTEYSNDSCGTKVLGGALELIKSQEQRIKELAEEVESLGAEKEHLDLVVEGKLKRTTALEKQVLKLTKENERLITAIPLWAKQCVELEERCMQLRADTVRKMHSMLCEGRVSNDTVVIVANQIAKEMLEGNNVKSENTCVCCGAVIPEGRQYCPNCKEGVCASL